MSSNEVFSDKFSDISYVPEPFRHALAEALNDKEKAHTLLYSPSFSTVGQQIPSSLLAITDERWLIFLDEGDETFLASATFDDTLLVELTTILLYGQLKIDFVKRGTPLAIALHFDSLNSRDYSEAIQSLLEGMEEHPFASSRSCKAALAIKDWPLKFQNIAQQHVPKGRRLREGMFWEAIYGGFGREIAPASALILTERELILFAEEKAPNWWSRNEEHAKYGEIITYFPLRNLANYRIIEQHQFDLLSLEVHAKHGGEKLILTIPTGRRTELEALLGGCLAVDDHHRFFWRIDQEPQGGG